MSITMVDLRSSPEEREWTFERDVSLLNQFREDMNDFLSHFEIDEKKKMRMILCVDEAAANIVEHSCPKTHANGSISFYVKAVYDGVSISVIFKDDGIPFDPTKAPLVNMKDHVKAGRRGGLGVHIMRTILNVFEYKYDEGCNIFTLGMNISSSE